MGYTAPLQDFTRVEHPISYRVSQGGGQCLPVPSKRNFTLTLFRFKFTGGSNVTLEGSKDSDWGWVDSHGQQVEEKLLITGGRVLTKLTSGGT